MTSQNIYIINLGGTILKSNNNVTLLRLAEMIKERDQSKKYPQLSDKTAIDLEEVIYQNIQYFAINDIYFNDNGFERRQVKFVSQSNYLGKSVQAIDIHVIARLVDGEIDICNLTPSQLDETIAFLQKVKEAKVKS